MRAYVASKDACPPRRLPTVQVLRVGRAEEGKEVKSDCTKEQYAEYKRNQRWAQKLLNRAVRQGIIYKPLMCEECGDGGIICGHHPDYRRPYRVNWLCNLCHLKHHRWSLQLRPLISFRYPRPDLDWMINQVVRRHGMSVIRDLWKARD